MKAKFLKFWDDWSLALVIIGILALMGVAGFWALSSIESENTTFEDRCVTDGGVMVRQDGNHYCLDESAIIWVR